MGLILAFALIHAVAIVAAVCLSLLVALALAGWTHEARPASSLRDESLAAATVVAGAAVAWPIGGAGLWIQGCGPLAVNPDVIQAFVFGTAVTAIPAAYSGAIRGRYGEGLLIDLQRRFRGPLA